MPKYRYDEDLFQDTSMTFGEHLEELRSCLFKAIIGLVIGFIIGLFFGGRVVAFIQTPLTDALTSYYQRQAENRLETELTTSGVHAGIPEGEEKERTPSDILIHDEGFLPERVFVQPEWVLQSLKDSRPEEFKDLVLPKELKKDSVRETLVPILLWRPNKDDPRVRVTALNAHEAFVIYVKAALLVGALLASPWIFYQIWGFVAAGLYPHEKHYVHIYLPMSLGLFFAGAALAFFFVFEPVLQFLFGFNQWLGIDPDPRISEWLGFVMMLPLGFGISFQLPMVMLFLERIGIFTLEAYLTHIRIAILVIFVISMFLTPADPWSMLLMAVPLTILYYGGILLCKYMPKRSSPFDDDEE